MKCLGVMLLVEVILAAIFFWYIKDDTLDGDFGLGMLFWLMIAGFVVIDVVGLGVHVWRVYR